MSRWKANEPVNQHVCKRIRQRRIALRISRQKLAATLGVTWQQIQKYDTGKSTVSAAKLWIIARELGVSVGYFFEGLPGYADLEN